MIQGFMEVLTVEELKYVTDCGSQGTVGKHKKGLGSEAHT